MRVRREDLNHLHGVDGRHDGYGWLPELSQDRVFQVPVTVPLSAAVAIAGHDNRARDDEVHRRKGFKGHLLSPARAGAQACGFWVSVRPGSRPGRTCGTLL